MAEPIQLAAAASQLRQSLVIGSEFLSEIPPPVYAIKPVIQMAQVTTVTAHPGHGKSAFTFLLVVGIVTGFSIGPFSFRKGKVLLMVGENADGSKQQMMAAFLKYHVPKDLWENVVVYPVRKPIEQASREVIAECIARKLGPFIAVVIDTSAAYFGGEDENNNVDMQRHASAVRIMINEHIGNPAVIMNCHPTKGAGRDNLVPRGGGALSGDIDQNLTVWNEGGMLSISYTKIRGAPFDQLTVALREQDVGFSDGTTTQIPVAVPLNEQEEIDARKMNAHHEAEVMRAIEELPDGHLGLWAEHLGWYFSDGKPNKSMVNRTLHRMEKSGKVKRVDGRWVKWTRKGQPK